jgi:hypothetical protein
MLIGVAKYVGPREWIREMIAGVSEENLRLTRTTRYLSAMHKSSGFEGTRPWRGPSDPSFLLPLTFRTSPKASINPADLSELIAKAAEDGVVFFVDTSLFDDRTDPAVFEALLGTTASTVLIPEVKRELAPYFSTRPQAAFSKALATKHPALREYAWTEPRAWRSTARDYYVTLLAVRKRWFDLMELHFTAINKRSPTAEEVAALRVEVQKMTGERGYILAKKGHTAKGQENRFTDEYLVYAAAEHSIITGERVILLTKDEDLLEQAFKLTWLMDTHYRSMLFARAYHDDFGSFEVVPFPPISGRLATLVAPGSNVLVRKPEGIEKALLPDRLGCVPFSCWVTGEYFSQFSFGNVRQFEQVLRVKAQTGGLSASWLESRNCHLWAAPLELPDELHGYAAVMHDRRRAIPGTDVAVPMLDVALSGHNNERFVTFEGR